jgi:hypothetical protein
MIPLISRTNPGDVPAFPKTVDLVSICMHAGVMKAARNRQEPGNRDREIILGNFISFDLARPGKGYRINPSG